MGDDKIWIRSSSRLIHPSRLLGRNDEHRQFAEENALQLSIELSQSEVRSISYEFEGEEGIRSYFEAFNETKLYLKETRQELRRLAYRTVNDKRNLSILLDTLPGSGTQVPLLKALIHTLKDLMIETKERLKKAKNEFDSAGLNFANLKSVVVEARKWESAEINQGAVVAARLSGRTRILYRDIDDAMVARDEKIYQIDIWYITADWVSQKIDEIPAESLVESEAIRNVFKNSLLDLERSAEIYLAN